MALKELRKSTNKKPVLMEEDVKKFIAKGGRLADDISIEEEGDHRLTLRIPKRLMDMVDVKRKERVGKISRNLWILEIIEKATKD